MKKQQRTLSDATKAAKLLTLAMQHNSISVEKLVEVINQVLPQTVVPSSGRLTGKSHEQYLQAARMLLEKKSEVINLTCPNIQAFSNCYQFFRGLENTIVGPEKNLFKFENATAQDTLLRMAPNDNNAQLSNLILRISLTDEAKNGD